MLKPNKIAFLILNYCSANDCLRIIRDIRKFSINHPIVVVDNASPDNSVKLLKNEELNLNFTFLQSKINGGYAKGNNIGLKYIENNFSCKYVAVCNPDIIVSKNTIFRLINHLDNDPSATIAGGQMYDSNNKEQVSAWKLPKLADDIILSSSLFLRIFGNPTKYKRIQIPQYVDVIQGAFFVARLNQFKEIGYFDENTFLYGEERIIGYKLKQKGRKLIFDPELTFLHKVGESINKEYTSKTKLFRLISDSRKIYYKYIRKEILNFYLFKIFVDIIFVEKKIIDIYFHLNQNK